MEMQWLINSIDMSELSSSRVYFEDFTEELRIPCHNLEWKEDVWTLFEERVKSAPIYTWYCTDTTVGIFAYFLDSELVCLSFQIGRKWDKNFYWLSKEAANSVSDLIETLKGKNKGVDEHISLLSDFNENEQNWDWEVIKKELATK